MINRFENREHAGVLLAELLKPYQNLDPIVLALPRGGVPVAYEIASRIGAPLDVIMVKKIGAPGHEEFAIGAVAEDEKPILNHKVISDHHYDNREIENIIVKRISEIRERAKIYRKKFPPMSLEGRNIIIVDDGLATGATMAAAIEWMRSQKIKKIIVATPVSSKEAALEIRKKSDDFISLVIPDDFWAVGMWYKDFPQVSDEEVVDLLQMQVIPPKMITQDVLIEAGMITLQGAICIPPKSRGIVIFAHGGGSSHKSPRNIFVAKALNDAGFGTLLFDLLTTHESYDRKNVFDIDLMGKRLLIATDWVQKNYPGFPIGFFGASTGAAAALLAASDRLDIFAIVSRGGRPDLALSALPKVYAPTLLLVGSEDGPVIPLNKLAKDKLKNSQMILIPKAGHLFEEPGTLEQVVEYAISWFSNSISLHLDADTPIKENIVSEIENNSIPFTKIDDLDSWLNQIKKHKIIMLGESTHGTREFYALRREISKKLIMEHGYNFIAVEGDWPDCFRLNNYVKNHENHNPKDVIKDNFHRWPTWMWANEEIPPLINWMRRNQKGGFYGLDVYSLFESLEEIKKHLEHIDPKIATKILEGYKCFESYKCDEISYAKSLLKIPEGCQEEVISNLRDVLRLRLQETHLSTEALFDIKQNARVISNAEKYYRAMMTGGSESWNVRDTHMMDTLSNLLHLHGDNAKAIVWAHNTHIGDYHATDMLQNGYINLGGLARERFGADNVFLLGFSSYTGEVTAGSAWGGAEKKMNLPRAQAGSYEDYFHQASVSMNSPQFLTTFNDLEEFSPLYRKLGHRAVGVVYDPNHESHGNYVPTQMAKRYDGIIFVDNTTALKSISTLFAEDEFPETWPQGL